MVERASSYYDVPFKVLRGFTKGDPLFPKLFNAMVDAFVRHCMTIVTEMATGM